MDRSRHCNRAIPRGCWGGPPTEACLRHAAGRRASETPTLACEADGSQADWRSGILGHKDLVADPGLTELEIHRTETPKLEALGSSGPSVEREVMGYLPYWVLNKGYDPPRWDLLTILAWFGVEMNSQGDITDWHGWGGERTANLVQDAHDNGVIVIITVINFSKTSIEALLKSPDARSTAIEACLDAMETHGADGINIDFEFVPLEVKAEFVTFMTDLKHAVTDAQPNGAEGHVSLAGPAIDWSGAYDYDQLLTHTDGIMSMTYGFHWSGGNPGPLAPLFGGDKWSNKCIAYTIDDYLKWGGDENRHKVFIGIPFYGRAWPVGDTNVPTDAQGDGVSIVFSKAKPEALANGAGWDDESKTPYYHKNQSSKLWQVWFDDRQSLQEKIAYIDAEDIGGIGIWAIGYEGQHMDLWEAIEDTLVGEGPEPPPDAGPEPPPEHAPEPTSADAGPTDTGTVVTPDALEPSGDTDTATTGDATGTQPGPTASIKQSTQAFKRVQLEDACTGGDAGSERSVPAGLLVLVGLFVGGLLLRRRMA